MLIVAIAVPICPARGGSLCTDSSQLWYILQPQLELMSVLPPYVVMQIECTLMFSRSACHLAT